MRYLVYIIAVIIDIGLIIAIFGIPIFYETSHNGVITDKWTEIEPATFSSYTRYVFEINDTYSITVTDFEYYNNEINSTYEWTKNNFELKSIWS